MMGGLAGVPGGGGHVSTLPPAWGRRVAAVAEATFGTTWPSLLLAVAAPRTPFARLLHQWAYFGGGSGPGGGSEGAGHLPLRPHPPPAGPPPVHGCDNLNTGVCTLPQPYKTGRGVRGQCYCWCARSRSSITLTIWRRRGRRHPGGAWVPGLRLAPPPVQIKRGSTYERNIISLKKYYL
jgi:hypothetical protein